MRTRPVRESALGPRESRPEFWLLAAVALLLCVFAAQAAGEAYFWSATSDEVTHLTAGYTYLVTGDHRLNPQHPPLIKVLAALPLLVLDPVLNLNDPNWASDQPNEWAFSYDFLYSNDADRLIFWGRMAPVMLGVLCGFYVYLWAAALWGRRGGLAAVLLYATCPTLIAHSSLVTMDGGLACFATVTFYHLWRHIRGDHLWHVWASALALGLALATKFAGVFLVPVWAMLLAWPLLAGGRDGRHRAGDRREALRRFVWSAVGSALVVLTVILAAYGFNEGPGAYIHGGSLVNVDHGPGYKFYFLGEFKQGRWWSYFIAALALKTPLPHLLAFAGAIVAAVLKKARAEQMRDEVFLALPPLVLLVATSAMADDLGVRYVLFVYPFAFIFIARLAQFFTRTVSGAVFISAFAGWCMFSAGRYYPHYLSYFNEAAGGPEQGHRYLDDSNIDWGQDLKFLKAYMDREGLERIRLGWPWVASTKPEAYGIMHDPVSPRDMFDATPLPGVYAMSIHMLVGAEQWAREGGVPSDWLNRYKPIGRAGYSILIYRFP